MDDWPLFWASRVSTRWPPVPPKNESGCKRLSWKPVSAALAGRRERSRYRPDRPARRRQGRHLHHEWAVEHHVDEAGRLSGWRRRKRCAGAGHGLGRRAGGRCNRCGRCRGHRGRSAAATTGAGAGNAGAGVGRAPGQKPLQARQAWRAGELLELFHVARQLGHAGGCVLLLASLDSLLSAALAAEPPALLSVSLSGVGAAAGLRSSPQPALALGLALALGVLQRGRGGGEALAVGQRSRRSAPG